MTHADTLEEQLVKLYERIDALERRIERLDGMLDGMGKGAASRIDALERRVEKLERKLNHKGGVE